MDVVEEYKKFLDEGKTERECVQAIVQSAEKIGYKNIAQTSSLKAGDRIYV
jgi:aspartyl aminopeptidase